MPKPFCVTCFQPLCECSPVLTAHQVATAVEPSPADMTPEQLNEHLNNVIRIHREHGREPLALRLDPADVELVTKAIAKHCQPMVSLITIAPPLDGPCTCPIIAAAEVVA